MKTRLTRAAVRWPPGSTTATPVTTRCSRPRRRRSIAAASSNTRPPRGGGPPRGSPGCPTNDPPRPAWRPRPGPSSSCESSDALYVVGVREHVQGLDLQEAIAAILTQPTRACGPPLAEDAQVPGQGGGGAGYIDGLGWRGPQ